MQVRLFFQDRLPCSVQVQILERKKTEMFIKRIETKGKATIGSTLIKCSHCGKPIVTTMRKTGAIEVESEEFDGPVNPTLCSECLNKNAGTENR